VIIANYSLGNGSVPVGFGLLICWTAAVGPLVRLCTISGALRHDERRISARDLCRAVANDSGTQVGNRIVGDGCGDGMI